MNIKAIMLGICALGIVAAAWWFYHQGQKSEKLVDVIEDNTVLEATLKRLKELEEQVRQQEHDHSEEMANIDRVNQKELTDARKKSGDFISDVMSGKLKLFDPHARCGRPGGTEGKTSTSSSVDNGETGAELSDEVERFLELEAARADEVVIQLTACQAALTADRK